MVTRADLNFVKEFDRRERIRREMIDELRSRVDVHSPQFDKIMTAGGEQHDKLAEYAAALDEMERNIAQESLEARERYIRICREILRLPAAELEIIRLRYQEGHAWNWIRRRLHYERSTVFRIHARALKLLSEEKAE